MSGLFDRLQDEINARGEPEGLSPIDLLDLPVEVAAVVKKIIRRNGMSLDEVAEELQQSPEDTAATLAELVKKKFVRQVEVQGEVWFKAQFARKPDKKLSQGVWSVLDNLLDQENQ